MTILGLKLNTGLETGKSKGLNFYVIPFRAEKERAQYFSEVNDLRAGLDHLSNEKVQIEDNEMPWQGKYRFVAYKCWINETPHIKHITDSILTTNNFIRH